MTKKPKMPKMGKRPGYKAVRTVTHKGPKVASHPKGPKMASRRGKALTGKTSSHFDKHIPVKGKGGGKTKTTAQENPFGAGEVIHYGFSK